jgi:zinc and cadmium transporter
MLLLFCILIVLASLFGGTVPLFIKPTHRRMQLTMSFIGGVMAGVAILDLLPEALVLGETKRVMLWLLAGFLAIFLLERFLPSHCHEVTEKEHHGCGHEHKLTWFGAFVGLSLHSVLAGVALGAAWQAGGLPIALGVFLAIILHKPFDGLTLVAMMRIANVAKPKVLAANGVFAFGVPIGVAFFYLGGGASNEAVSAALAFSAGMFLCISLSDLLPELQFHGHDRMSLTLSLILGLAVSWGVSSLHSHAADEHLHENHDESSTLPEH